MNTDVLVLTYNLTSKEGQPEERTQWNSFPLHHGYASPNVFSSRTSQTLRILHEDETHYRALIWRPVEINSRQAPIPDSSARKAAPGPPPRMSGQAQPPRMSAPGGVIEGVVN